VIGCCVARPVSATASAGATGARVTGALPQRARHRGAAGGAQHQRLLDRAADDVAGDVPGPEGLAPFLHALGLRDFRDALHRLHEVRG
jgi:hypothetical protein